MITKIPFKLIKIEDSGYHLLIEAKINNKTTYLLIDTGASKTVFDASRIINYTDSEDLTDNEILSAGLGTNTMQSKSIFIKTLKIGEFEINNYNAIAIDMQHVNESYEKLGLAAFDGVLGCDILYKYKASIDFKTKYLKLRKRK
ncbi:MAG: retropepsin-like aspartic protease [Bacteroidetes bacterium]|nr:retropepsin-like aspartic protease [Bacteroidota bacterium]